MLIKRLGLIGVGLIGGSLALALKRAGVCTQVAGFDQSEAALGAALELGVIDSGHTDLTPAMAGADIVVLATPLGAMPALFRQLAPLLMPGMLITDVGSAKMSVIEAARESLAGHIGAVVPGHPIAGTEKSGVRHAFPELFAGRKVILTPIPENSADAVAQIRTMWEMAGAKVELLDAAHHDQVLAASSHLPHLLAYALVDCLARMDAREEIFRFAAGGFADFTRIASSSPEMWHDVCAANRDNLLAAMDRFEQHLRQIRVAMERGDSGALLEIFRSAKAARDQFPARRQSTPK